MNINVIRHLLRINSDYILAKSIQNCHGFGVDSILFDDTPGAGMRLFVARPEHVLWKNHFNYQKAGNEQMNELSVDEQMNELSVDEQMNELSVAFHPHHCDLELECVKGSLKNIKAHELQVVHASDYGPIEDSWGYWKLKKFLYKSKILQGECKFTYLGDEILSYSWSSKAIRQDQSIVMPAKHLHTIFVPKGQVTAWMVYSGREDPNYEPLCYSNCDLTTFDDSTLYQPITKTRLMESLTLAFPNLLDFL